MILFDLTIGRLYNAASLGVAKASEALTKQQLGDGGDWIQSLYREDPVSRHELCKEDLNKKGICTITGEAKAKELEIELSLMNFSPERFMNIKIELSNECGEATKKKTFDGIAKIHLKVQKLEYERTFTFDSAGDTLPASIKALQELKVISSEDISATDRTMYKVGIETLEKWVESVEPETSGTARASRKKKAASRRESTKKKKAAEKKSAKKKKAARTKKTARKKPGKKKKAAGVS